jgi:sulfate transport system substrate-binding protein
MRLNLLAASILVSILAVGTPISVLADVILLNVSYDPTREFCQEINEAFGKYWKWRTGHSVRIK